MDRTLKQTQEKNNDSQSLDISRQRPRTTMSQSSNTTSPSNSSWSKRDASIGENSTHQPPQARHDQPERIVSLRRTSEKLAGRAIEPDIMEYLREFYGLLDSSNSGEVSRSALTSFVISLGIDVESEFVDKLMGGRESFRFTDLVQKVNSLPYSLSSRSELNSAATVLLDSESAGACQMDAADFRDLMERQGIVGPELNGLIADFGKQTEKGLKIDLEKLATLVSF